MARNSAGAAAAADVDADAEAGARLSTALVGSAVALPLASNQVALHLTDKTKKPLRLTDNMENMGDGINVGKMSIYNRHNDVRKH